MTERNDSVGRARLIKLGLITPASVDGPTPQPWRDEPTVRLDISGKRAAIRHINENPHAYRGR